MEIRKISTDQGQEQTSSLVWYLSRKRLHTGVGLLFGLGSFRNLHSNDESSTSLCYEKKQSSRKNKTPSSGNFNTSDYLNRIAACLMHSAIYRWEIR